jgi:putative transposase
LSWLIERQQGRHPSWQSPSEVKLVISDAQKGLTNAIWRLLQGNCWEHCKAHFARNLLQWQPKAQQGIVTAALRSVFAQEKAAEVKAR